MVDRTSLQTIIYDAILIALTRRGFLYLGSDHLIFHGGGGRKSEKKYRACLEWKKKKSNITNTSKKKYRAQKISKLAILYGGPDATA